MGRFAVDKTVGITIKIINRLSRLYRLYDSIEMNSELHAKRLYRRLIYWFILIGSFTQLITKYTFISVTYMIDA